MVKIKDELGSVNSCLWWGLSASHYAEWTTTTCMFIEITMVIHPACCPWRCTAVHWPRRFQLLLWLSLNAFEASGIHNKGVLNPIISVPKRGVQGQGMEKRALLGSCWNKVLCMSWPCPCAKLDWFYTCVFWLCWLYAAYFLTTSFFNSIKDPTNHSEDT